MQEHRIALALITALSASGCFILDDQHLVDLMRDSGPPVDSGPRPDTGMLFTDGGMIPFDDHCGAENPRTILRRTTLDILIDTNQMSNSVSTNCGGAPTPGNDVFLAIDVQPAEYWHFHLKTDPTDPDSANRQPALYLLRGRPCDDRECSFSSDVCGGVGDEHFGFVANEPGIWYLGIDDRLAGGGRYVLQALRPVCGDGERIHGESCDDENVTGGDGCSSNCLIELETSREMEPNDNPTEANYLILPGSNEIVVEGVIGGEGACRYADTFAVNVPENTRVSVDVLDTSGAVCADSALTEGFQLALRNTAFADAVPSGTTDGAGCSILRSPEPLRGGLYYVTVLLPEDLERPKAYRLRIRVSA
jgi:cysteine-rich repeat protein